MKWQQLPVEAVSKKKMVDKKTEIMDIRANLKMIAMPQIKTKNKNKIQQQSTSTDGEKMNNKH